MEHTGGEGRCTCSNDKHCAHGLNKDGQVKRRPKPLILKSYRQHDIDDWKRENNLFFERENFCETCRKIANPGVFGKNAYVVDCRTEQEAEKETKDNINTNWP